MRIATAFVCLAIATPAFADDAVVGSATKRADAPNALYAELGGNSGWYSLNFERYLRPDVAVRVGMSYMSVTATAGSGTNQASSSASWATLPIMAEYLGVSSGSHALELGAGINFMYFSGNASTFDSTAMSSGIVPVGTATIGYRYSSPTGGFVFRAGYTPLFFVTTEQKAVFHWGGMSFGYRF